MSDRILFLREAGLHADEPVDAVCPVINGRRLDELWWEVPEAKGGSRPMTFSTAYELWRSGHRTSSWNGTKDGRVAVLTCGCGDFGCGGVAARITIEADHVTWSEFAGPDPDMLWIPVNLGPFRFTRSEYEQALQSAREAGPPQIDEVEIAFLRLLGIKRTSEKLLSRWEKRHHDLPPDRIVELFARYSAEAMKLQAQLPELFGDMRIRPTPNRSGEGYDERRSHEQKELAGLVEDISYILKMRSRR